MEDYARAVGSPRRVEIKGREYLVHPARPRDLGDLQAWLKAHAPNPKAEAIEIIKTLPETHPVAIEIWREAAAKPWPPDFRSPEFSSLLLQTRQGQGYFLYVWLRRGQPSLTVEQAEMLADDLEIEELTAIAEAAMPGEPGDPKATTTD